MYEFDSYVLVLASILKLISEFNQKDKVPCIDDDLPSNKYLYG